MDNEITVTVDELLSLPDNSIVDPIMLRQIGLMTTSFKHKLDRETIDLIARKIRREFQHACLYPQIMRSFYILPNNE